MRTRSLAFMVVVCLALPWLARAERGRVKATRAAVASEVKKASLFPPNVRYPLKDSEVRIRARIDKAHFADGHVHIVGHTPRIVTWRIPGLGISGTIKSDTLVGGHTTFSDFKHDPLPWSAQPSQD